MRTYLAILDTTPEARTAVRFAARRAARTGGGVHILALAAPAEFVAFGGLQATMEEEARVQAEALVRAAAGQIAAEDGIRPMVEVAGGEPVALILRALRDGSGIGALVLAAAPGHDPGPLVHHFAGMAGQLPCPLMIVPGGLDDAALDRLS